MGSRYDDRSSRRGPKRERIRPPTASAQPRPDRAYDREEDMGGSGWSGASGRGGMSYEAHDAVTCPYEHGYHLERGYRPEGGYLPQSGYRPESGYDRELAPGRDYSGRGFTGSDFAARDHGSVQVPEDPRGRHGPHYGKGPKGYKRSDERTRDEVCDLIAHQGHIDASDVEVTVKDGIVTLTGTVAQRHHKKGLEQLVEHLHGVEDVHNELRLKRNEPAPEPALTDARPDDGRDRNGGGARA